MESFLRRVNSFRKYQKDENKSLKVLTSPRRKSFEVSFLFPSKGSYKDDKSKSCSETGICTNHEDKSSRKTSAKDGDTIEDLLRVQRFRPQLDFMRKFLREYSRRQLSLPYEIPAHFAERNENTVQNNSKQSDAPRPYGKAFSCPQIGFDRVSCFKRDYPPSYWLTCTYKFVADSKILYIVVRQTGTLPEIKFSKLSAAIEIDGQGGKQSMVLAKSQKDKSFKSHEIVFNEQELDDLKEKMLSLKMFIHNTPHRKKCVGQWEIELTDVSEKEKIGCKRFVFEI